MRKFTLLLVLMATINISAKVQLSLWTLGKSWNTSYNASSKTITFSNSGWDGGCGWEFGDKDISATPYLVIEFDNLTQEVAVKYEGKSSTDADENHTATSSNIASGTSVAYIDLSSNGTYTLKKAGNAYLQVGTAGDVKIKDAYLLSSEEYTEETRYSSREISNLDLSSLNQEGTSSGSSYNSTTHTISFTENNYNDYFGWWDSSSKTTYKSLVAVLSAKTSQDLFFQIENSTPSKDVTISSGTLLGIIDVDGLGDKKDYNKIIFKNPNKPSFDVTISKVYFSSLSKTDEENYLNTIGKGKVKVIIGSTGYATFSSGSALDFSSISDFTAYVAAEAPTSSTITLTSVESAPANTGLILKGTPGTYWVPTTGSPASVTSQFTASVDATNIAASTDGAYRYIFAKDASDNVGFFKLTSDHTLAANKAYLETSADVAPAGARVALIFDDDTTNGIIDMNHTMNDGIYYNMNGMRIERPAKGLFIRNGKKIIIK